MLNSKRHHIITGAMKVILPFFLLLMTVSVSAQQTAAAAGDTTPKSVWSNPIALSMLVIIFVLLLVIALLANVVLGTAKWHYNKVGASAKVISGMLLLLTPALASAQDAVAPTAPGPDSIGGLSPLTFYMLVSVIAVELIVILLLGFFVKNFLRKERLAAAAAEGVAAVQKPTLSWWDKLNRFRPVEQESKIDLGHDYDGIRELDNKLPGWWLYGFYGCIIIAVIYLWRYHVAETAPLSKEEFEIAWQKGEEQKAAFLAKAANKVDENTVVLITEKPKLAAAEAIFKQTCSACHGKEGQGGVGPNLTDDYWIHGGSIKDVFKTIKYGWPEKGMKSWKDDYSPVQIAQLSSYIKSLYGTNPPNPKEKQGDLYKEGGAAAGTDSSAAAVKDTAIKVK